MCTLLHADVEIEKLLLRSMQKFGCFGSSYFIQKSLFRQYMRSNAISRLVHIRAFFVLNISAVIFLYK